MKSSWNGAIMKKRMPKDPVTGPLYKHAWNTCFKTLIRLNWMNDLESSSSSSFV